MNPKFQSAFNALASERQDILQQLQRVAPEKMHVRPHPGKWSLSEVLTHVLTTEQLSLVYLKKKSLGIDSLEDSGVVEKLKVVAMKISQRLPLRYTAPKAVVTHTPEGLSAAELINRWEAFLDELRVFLSSIEDKNVHKLIYKHPVFGRMDAAQALTSMREHFNHHLPQIKRLMK